MGSNGSVSFSIGLHEPDVSTLIYIEQCLGFIDRKNRAYRFKVQDYVGSPPLAATQLFMLNIVLEKVRQRFYFICKWF